MGPAETLTKVDHLLLRFTHSEALTVVTRSRIRAKRGERTKYMHPLTALRLAVGVIRELIRRDTLHTAVAGRMGVKLIPLLRFVRRNVWRKEAAATCLALHNCILGKSTFNMIYLLHLHLLCYGFEHSGWTIQQVGLSCHHSQPWMCLSQCVYLVQSIGCFRGSMEIGHCGTCPWIHGTFLLTFRPVSSVTKRPYPGFPVAVRPFPTVPHSYNTLYHRFCTVSYPCCIGQHIGVVQHHIWQIVVYITLPTISSIL